MSYATQPVVYNSDYYAAMANDLIKGRQKMTLQEQKILRLIITQVVKFDKDLKTYTTTISELASFLDIPKNNLYRDISDICDKLMKRVVHIGSRDPKNPWRKFHWVQLAEYDGHGNLTIMLSEQIKPYVIQLEGYFTSYKYINIQHMQSTFGVRLYELIKSEDWKERDHITYTVAELRIAFACEDLYKKWSHFKERVIEVAVREINIHTDIYINPDYIEFIKTGRSITSVKFWIQNNNEVMMSRKKLTG